MSAAVTNMVVMFGAMQLSKRIPFEENPEYVNYARCFYVAAQLTCLAIFYFCSIQVCAGVIPATDPQIKKKNDLSVLKFVNAKSPMSQEPGELVTTTHRDYDLQEINKSIRGVFMGAIFVGLMHFYFGYTNPYVETWRACADVAVL